MGNIYIDQLAELLDEIDDKVSMNKEQRERFHVLSDLLIKTLHGGE